MLRTTSIKIAISTESRPNREIGDRKIGKNNRKVRSLTRQKRFSKNRRS